MKNMRLHLLFTGLGAGNIGDEAMFAGFCAHFRLPLQTTVEVYDPSAAVVQTFPRHADYIHFENDQAAEASIQQADAAFLVGGTPIAEEWGLDWPMRALAKRLRYCWSYKVPVYAVGVGVDSLQSPEAKDLFREAFRTLTGWSVRTDRCRQALLDLGVDEEHVIVGADLAWLFTRDAGLEDWAAAQWREWGIDPEKPIIAVNPVNERWPGKTSVKEALARSLDRAVRELGVQAAAVCNEVRPGKYFDTAAANELASLMQEQLVLAPSVYQTPSQMAALLACCSLTMSQRYHYTVLSVAAKAPCLSFARGQKMSGLLAEFDEEPVGTMEDCDPDTLYRRIKETLENPAATRKRQSRAARCLAKRSENLFHHVAQFMGPVQPHTRLASVAELQSPRFTNFMEEMNAFAAELGLRQFTDWSKIWEYPWLWFHGLRRVVGPGVRVLDIGSEISPMSWFMESKGAKVTMVENDGQWVPEWKRVSKTTGLKPSWKIVKNETLPFRDSMFDVVTSFSVIEHQPDKALAVAEALRVLKPGGLLVLSFDICEEEMGMSFPEWNGKALTMREFEELVWSQRDVATGGPIGWNTGDIPEFLQWHRQSAEHHRYVVGASVVQKLI